MELVGEESDTTFTKGDACWGIYERPVLTPGVSPPSSQKHLLSNRRIRNPDLDGTYRAAGEDEDALMYERREIMVDSEKEDANECVLVK